MKQIFTKLQKQGRFSDLEIDPIHLGQSLISAAQIRFINQKIIDPIDDLYQIPWNHTCNSTKES